MGIPSTSPAQLPRSAKQRQALPTQGSCLAPCLWASCPPLLVPDGCSLMLVSRGRTQGGRVGSRPHGPWSFPKTTKGQAPPTLVVWRLDWASRAEPLSRLGHTLSITNWRPSTISVPKVRKLPTNEDAPTLGPAHASGPCSLHPEGFPGWEVIPPSPGGPLPVQVH